MAKKCNAKVAPLVSFGSKGSAQFRETMYLTYSIVDLYKDNLHRELKDVVPTSKATRQKYTCTSKEKVSRKVPPYGEDDSRGGMQLQIPKNQRGECKGKKEENNTY